jgi:hypothetical protein
VRETRLGAARSVPRSAATGALRLSSALSFLYFTAVLCAAASPLSAQFESIARRGDSSVMPVAVFGTDDRRALTGHDIALAGSVGLVFNNQARSVCTGFCVADQVVATAAHCLFRTAGERRPDLRHFRFVLGGAGARRSEARIAGHETASPARFVLAGSVAPRIEPPIDATRDWALMRVDRPVCKGRALPVADADPEEVARLAATDRLYNVGFHRDFQDWSLAVSGPCPAQTASGSNITAAIGRDFSEPERLVLHTCDTGGASSGSPLLVHTPDGGWSVVGLNVGTYIQTRMLTENGRVIHRFKADAIANTAVASSVFLDRIALISAATVIADRPRIRAVQKALAERNYYRGRIDGAFGPQLRQAIEAYEGYAGLPTTGLATTALHEQLVPKIGPGRKPPRSHALASRRSIYRHASGRMRKRFASSRGASRYSIRHRRASLKRGSSGQAQR